MILLTAHSLTKGRRIPMVSMSLDLKERDSTASMVPEDMTGISVGSWLLDDTKPGANTVWRVRSIRTAYATDTPTVELEHAIGMLRDLVLFGAIGPEKITGKDVSTCTAKQAVTYILGKSSDWTLGSFEFNNVSMPYKFEGDTLWDALQTVSDTLEDCWWSYDMTVYPFKLNIKKATTGVACELRPGRNLATLTKTVDRSGMYTRFYPIGKDDLHISGDYVEKNTKTYGVISKIETDTSKETADELKKWANRRLAKHAEPKVSITAEGTELADATGESLDRLTLGRICRIPLTEFNTTIEERIVELRYADKVHEPERVTVTLANNQEDVTTIIAQSIKEGASPSGKAARSGARSNREDHAWIEDTSDHVALCAIGIIGTDAKGNPNWVRLSKLQVDENGIYGEVQSVQNDVVIASTRIEQNENAISLEAERRIAEDKSLAGRIKVEADKVGMVVEVKNGKNVIKAGSIAVAINNAGDSEALINADKITLKGTTTIDTRLGLDDSNHLLIKGDTYIYQGGLYTNNIIVASNSYILFHGTSVGGDAIVKNEDVRSMIIKANVDGDTLQLWKRGDNVSGEPSITFRKAAAPNITLAWNSSNHSVKATASGATTKYYHVTTAFYHPSNAYYIALFHTDADTGSTNYLSGSGHRIALKRTGLTVKIVDPNNDDAQYPESPTYTIPLKTETFTQDGNYDPPSGYAGFSSVSVQVDSAYSGRTFRCTGKEETYPGSTTYFYTFRLEGNYGFSVNDNYTFYRTNWP